MKNSPETLKKRRELKKAWKEKIDPNSFPHQIIRVCKDCGQSKPCDWLSSFTQTGKPEYKTRCRNCNNKLQEKRRKNRWTTIRIKQKERQKRVKQQCIDYLGGSCSKCGYKRSIRALSFHHKKRSEKYRDISKMIVNNGFEKIRTELDKCVLVCANCHAEIEEKYERDKICLDIKKKI